MAIDAAAGNVFSHDIESYLVCLTFRHFHFGGPDVCQVVLIGILVMDVGGEGERFEGVKEVDASQFPVETLL